MLVAEDLSPGLGLGIEGMGTGLLGGKNLPQTVESTKWQLHRYRFESYLCDSWDLLNPIVP